MSYGFSQETSCAFSDGHYHYSIQLSSSENLPNDFDKVDFINFLEVNSNISNADSELLNQNIVDVFKSYPVIGNDFFQKFVYIISTDDSLDIYLAPFSESVSSTFKYCDCNNSDGLYANYIRLFIDELPPTDFDKADFIQHLQINSNISVADNEFLNSSITEVSLAFPSSQSDNLRKTVFVLSTYDSMLPFLYYRTESFEVVELICDNAVLSVRDSTDLSGDIKIVPNPVANNSIITIDERTDIDYLIIYDLTGKIIAQRPIRHASQIPLKEFKLDPGFYFFKFSSEKGSIIKKVIFK